MAASANGRRFRLCSLFSLSFLFGFSFAFAFAPILGIFVHCKFCCVILIFERQRKRSRQGRRCWRGGGAWSLDWIIASAVPMRGCGTLTDVRVLRLPFIAHISCLPHFCQLLPFSPSSPSRSTPSPLHLFTSFSKFPIFAFANENEIFNKNDSRCFHCGDCCCCCCDV